MFSPHFVLFVLVLPVTTLSLHCTESAEPRRTPSPPLPLTVLFRTDCDGCCSH